MATCCHTHGSALVQSKLQKHLEPVSQSLPLEVFTLCMSQERAPTSHPVPSTSASILSAPKEAKEGGFQDHIINRSKIISWQVSNPSISFVVSVQSHTWKTNKLAYLEVDGAMELLLIRKRGTEWPEQRQDLFKHCKKMNLNARHRAHPFDLLK